jgi:hypothetical protein
MLDRVRGYHGDYTPGPKLYPIVWPPVGPGIDVTFLGDVLICVPTHWTFDTSKGKAYTAFCPGAYSCERCSRQRKPEGRYYIAAFEHRRKRVIGLSFTFRSVATVCCLVPQDRPLYGVRVSLARSEPRITAPVSVELYTSHTAWKWEKPWPDLTPTLERIYGAGCLDGGPGNLMQEGGDE